MKALRFVADTVFAKRYGHRAVAPETVAVVRADEAHHRDVNHGFADELAGGPVVAAIPAAWPHAELVPHWRDAA